MTKSEIPPIKKTDNCYEDIDINKTQLFNEYFITQSTVDDSGVDLPPLTYNQTCSIDNIDITETDVKDVLDNLDISKATGPDGINPRLLKEASSQLCGPLSKFFNRSLEIAKYPSVWKEANVSPIYKKDDPSLLTEEVNGANSTVWNFPCTTSDDGDGFVRKLFQGTRMFLKFNMPEGRRHKVDYEFSWTACGARITSRTGTIHSPFYPGYYPIQQTCAYIIDAASGSNVILDFTELDLVQGEDCEDSIKVYDGINSNGRLLQYIRGSAIPASIVSSSSRMYITFNPTCNHVSGKGFLAKWQVCGSVTNEEDGELLTPRYPQTYLRNIRCMTTITTTPGKIVNLMFEDFSVGSDIGGQCINDYVEISDGFVLQSTLIGRYCGARTTFMINSTSNTLNVLLVSTSDRNLGFRGYKAKYHSLIKGELTTTTPIPDNTTIVYSYVQDPDYFSDTSIIVTVVLVLIPVLLIVTMVTLYVYTSIIVTVVLVLIAVLLIVAVVTLYIFLRRKKPPLIIPEQKIVVPPSPGKPNDEILNFRENTQLIDIYKGINSKSPTLQEQLRDRRRSTSFLPRDIYSQPHRHRKESIPEMESELAAPPMVEKPDVEMRMPNITVYDADDYAKVNKRQEKVSEDFGTFGKKRGYNNQAYTEGNLQIRESKDMMYL
ncbi:hypothetical protein FSP39_012782 [Pinctada imbricata]|uniref:CUB domain-containing protein n=1 Tax=Pinctada imbricata TaxID=66713 RepID=A0AA89C4W3_PINIB|nr:hypothetical protein FSP39_012782 [Pinctada imbricata]